MNIPKKELEGFTRIVVNCVAIFVLAPVILIILGMVANTAVELSHSPSVGIGTFVLLCGLSFYALILTISKNEEKRQILDFLKECDGAFTIADLVVQCRLTAKAANGALNRMILDGLCRSTIDESGNMYYELNTGKRLSSQPNLKELAERKSSDSEKDH